MVGLERTTGGVAVLKVPDPDDRPWPHYFNPFPISPDRMEPHGVMKLIYRLFRKIDELEERIEKLERRP